MSRENQPVVDALWQTKMQSSHEKLVLYYLMSKHDLSENYSNDWKRVQKFMENFSDRWCNLREIKDGTRLSERKLTCVLEGLKERGYIKASTRLVNAENLPPQKKGTKEVAFAITEKLFHEFGQQNSVSHEQRSA